MNLLRVPRGVFVLAIALLVACSSFSERTGTTSAALAVGSLNILTHHNDPQRTGANLSETTLNTTNVAPGQFGLLFRLAVDDQIYAQPLYVSQMSIAGGTHDVLFVATVNNSVYAFDAESMSIDAPLAAGKVQLGVYDATGSQGGPGVLVAQTDEIAPTTGWNTMSVTTPVLLSPGTYWLAFLPSDNQFQTPVVAAGAACGYVPGYGSLPAQFSTNHGCATGPGPSMRL